MKRYEQEQNYILSCVNNEDETLKTDKEKTQYIYERFHSEYGWRIKQAGEFSALVDWLQGLALNIAFYNCDILELARGWGSLPQNASERQEDKILNNYWKFMAMRILGLFRKHKIGV